MKSLGNVYQAAESAVHRTHASFVCFCFVFSWVGKMVKHNFLFRINNDIFQCKTLPQLTAALQPVLEEAEARLAARSQSRLPELAGLANNCKRSRSHCGRARAPPLGCTRCLRSNMLDPLTEDSLPKRERRKRNPRRKRNQRQRQSLRPLSSVSTWRSGLRMMSLARTSSDDVTILA